MPFNLPIHQPIQPFTKHTTNKLESQRNVRNSMDKIGRMYPERNTLPSGVRDAIKYSDSERY